MQSVCLPVRSVRQMRSAVGTESFENFLVISWSCNAAPRDATTQIFAIHDSPSAHSLSPYLFSPLPLHVPLSGDLRKRIGDMLPICKTVMVFHSMWWYAKCHCVVKMEWSYLPWNQVPTTPQKLKATVLLQPTIFFDTKRPHTWFPLSTSGFFNGNNEDYRLVFLLIGSLTHCGHRHSAADRLMFFKSKRLRAARFLF